MASQVPTTLAALAARKKKATVRSRVEDEDRWKPALLARLQRENAPLLHLVYLALTGSSELPMVVCENQHDQVKSPHLAVMYRLVKFLTQELCAMDSLRCTWTRVCVNRQRKYGMRHDGSHGTYAGRKATSIVVATALLERYCATPLLEVLDAARDAKHKLDDLCDALLLALVTAVEWFALAAKDRDPKARPLRDGARSQVVGGTLRVLGVDPGTSNYAHCLIEVSELLPPHAVTPASALPSGGGSGGVAEEEADYAEADGDLLREPQPVFRVLLWELLHLNEGGPTGTVKVHYALHPDQLDRAPFYRPAVRDIADMMRAPATSVSAKKRKRAPEDDAEPTKKKARLSSQRASEPEPLGKTASVTAKKRKRAHEDDATTTTTNAEPKTKKARRESEPPSPRRPPLLIDLGSDDDDSDNVEDRV